jgi:predicted nucleic acid-binding protein
MRAVIDTNVAIAANGRDTHASLACQLECVELLQKLTADGNRHRICVDDRDQILEEYRAHLYHRGEPGVGDRFYRYLHDHMYTGARVIRVAITSTDDDARGFVELPPNDIDRSDRKFLAVALLANATIVNATDTDWYEKAESIARLGVQVKQLCPEHGCHE